MPARRKPPIEHEPDPKRAAPAQGVGRNELEPDAELVLLELGAAGSDVLLERENDANPAQRDYIGRFQAGQFSRDMVRDEYGGGAYWATVIDAVQGPLNPVRFAVDKRFAGKRREAASPMASDPLERDLLKSLLIRATATPAPTPAAPARDPFLEKVLFALLTREQSGTGGRDTATIINEMTAAFRQGMEIGREASGQNPPEQTIASVAEKFMPTFNRIIDAYERKQSAAALRPVPTMPNGNGNHGDMMVAAWLRPFVSYLPKLVALADTGADATLYADVIMDNVPPASARDFALGVLSDRAEADVFTAVPDLAGTAQRTEFVHALVHNLREALRAGAQQETES